MHVFFFGGNVNYKNNKEPEALLLHKNTKCLSTQRSSTQRNLSEEFAPSQLKILKSLCGCYILRGFLRIQCLGNCPCQLDFLG